eukprot:m.122124 g.122124  ORF g.122124 m.122124 type:complete len:85 (+) comp52111_c0_seq15:1518-1772(+)
MMTMPFASYGHIVFSFLSSFVSFLALFFLSLPSLFFASFHFCVILSSVSFWKGEFLRVWAGLECVLAEYEARRGYWLVDPCWHV